MRNAQQILPEALRNLYAEGRQEEGVLVGFTTLLYKEPRERVVFWQEFYLNPFRLLSEALFSLAGRVGSFTGKPSMYPIILNPEHVGAVVDMIKKDSFFRREIYPASSGREIILYVWVSDGLNMHVVCGSADVVWHCFGADLVTFSLLQEYLAARIGTPVGAMWYHASLHGHLSLLASLTPLPSEVEVKDPYEAGEVKPFPLMSIDPDLWDRDLRMFLDEGDRAIGWRDPFFRRVAVPMLRAWRAYQASDRPDNYLRAIEELGNCRATDWALAGKQWMTRRLQQWQKRESTKS